MAKSFENVDVSGGDQNLIFTAQGFWVGTGGDLAVEDVEGNQVIIKNIESASFIPIAGVFKILQTGTTASDVIALSKQGVTE